MLLQEINQILQISSITVLLLICLLLIRYLQYGMHTWVGVGFTIAIICYLVIETNAIQNSSLFFTLALTGAITIPVFFWLLAKAIFDDHFRPGPPVAIGFIVQIILHAHVYLRKVIELAEGVQGILYVTAELVSIGFLVAGLYTALRTRQADLIDSRIRFRNTFIIITAALIGITLIVEATPLAQQSIAVLQLLQRGAIFSLSVFFLVSNIEWRSGFFFREIPKPKPGVLEDSSLMERLKALLEDQQVYKKEGLTIRELAGLMNEPEYKLRRTINGQLGFKNFNDFINQYRIREATEILADSSQNKKTILEIAYAIGYQSIGPFNKAFKQIKGATPTAFRKSQQNL